eukprot:1334509-Heterocapsa_arctica.AAC.1
MTAEHLRAKPMTISHNGVIACEDAVPYDLIDYIYIRAPSGASWLLFDRNLLNSPIRAVGNASWDYDDMSFGQREAMKYIHTSYAEIRENDWPCNIQQCKNCYIWMPAGYTTC